MITINSKENKTFKYLKSLQQKKVRDKEKLFFVEGFVVLKEALKYQIPKCIAVTKSKVNEINELKINTEIYLIDDNIFHFLTETVNSQGIIAYFEHIHKIGVDSINGNKYILADDVRDPGNLGGLIRSADGFEVGVILTPECVELYNPKLIRSTMASIFRVQIIKLTNKDEVKDLKSRYEIVSTNVIDGENSRNFQFSKNTILVLGNEAKGVSKKIQDISDRRIYIRTNNIDSLNVNVAGSILMYEMIK